MLRWRRGREVAVGDVGGEEHHRRNVVQITIKSLTVGEPVAIVANWAAAAPTILSACAARPFIAQMFPTSQKVPSYQFVASI